MNSLEELNGYSATVITYQDERPYTATFSNVTNQAVTVGQGGNFPSPNGVDILTMVSAPDLAYELDFGNVATQANIQITWANTSAYTITSNAGVYNLYGISTVEEWDEIKNPTITLANLIYDDDFSYTSTLYDGAGNIKTWTTNVTVDALATVVQTYTYAEDLASNLSFGITDTNVAGGPITYTVVFTQTNPNVAANPGRFVTNSNIYGGYGNALTISGTKSEVNSYTVKYDPPNDYTNPISLTYTATRYDNGVETNTTGTIGLTLTNTVQHEEYTASTALGALTLYEGKAYLNGYSITDMPDYETERTYTARFTIGNDTYANFYVNGTKVTGTTFTLTGTKANINAQLADTTNTYILANNKVGSTTVLYKLTRTSPDTVILANNVSATISSVAPVAGTAWQGGLYIGTAGGDYVVVVDKSVQSAAYSRYRWVETSAPVGGPGTIATSATSGTSNTNALRAWDIANSNKYAWLLPAVAMAYTRGSMTGDAGGWFLPSTSELELARTANALIGTASSGYAFWTSTLDSGNNIQLVLTPSGSYSYTYAYARASGIQAISAPMKRIAI